VLRAFESRRRFIRADWENLLRLERVSSPLAHPDTLVHRLAMTLDEIFAGLALSSPRRHPPRVSGPRCPCSRNPWLAYFAAGRQALRGVLIEIQASNPALTAPDRDQALACLDEVFGHIARHEIEAFCAICQYRPAANAGHPRADRLAAW